MPAATFPPIIVPGLDSTPNPLLVYLGAEFHPPALPEPEPMPLEEQPEEEEKQPVVPGQPTARSPRVKKGTKKAAGPDLNGNVAPPPKRARKAAAPRKRKSAPPSD